MNWLTERWVVVSGLCRWKQGEETCAVWTNGSTVGQEAAVPTLLGREIMFDDGSRDVSCRSIPGLGPSDEEKSLYLPF